LILLFTADFSIAASVQHTDLYTPKPIPDIIFNSTEFTDVFSLEMAFFVQQPGKTA
jgi:hypothetical protein